MNILAVLISFLGIIKLSRTLGLQLHLCLCVCAVHCAADFPILRSAPTYAHFIAMNEGESRLRQLRNSHL